MTYWFTPKVCEIALDKRQARALVRRSVDINVSIDPKDSENSTLFVIPKSQVLKRLERGDLPPSALERDIENGWCFIRHRRGGRP